MKIGFTTTSLRQIKDIEKIVDFAARAGAECIEWGGDIHVTDTETANHAKTLCEAAGINTLIYGSYYRVGDNDRAEWKRICEISSSLGAESVRVWLGRTDSELTDEKTYAGLLADISHICRIADEYGIKVCCECHGNTYNNNTDAFLKIRADADCGNFGTYFQSLYKKEEYDIDRIERTFPFIDSVHISYFEQVREQFPNYNGKYIDSLLEKLIQCGFDGNILIEFTWPSYRFGISSILRRDIARLRKNIGEKR